MKFDQSVIIVGDMGQLKAYRATSVVGVDRRDPAQVSHAQTHGVQKESITLELICDAEYIDAHKRMKDTVSDEAGRMNTSPGEANNSKIESQKRALKFFTEEIKKIIADEAPQSWYLAFPKESHKQLVEELDAQTKKNLAKTLPSDLTKTAKNKLLSHFE